MCSKIFLTKLEVFGNVIKHSLKCLIYISSQLRLKLKSNQGNKIAEYVLYEVI